MQTLVVSEDFYSIQGEGPSAGHPAVFLRLAGCNLRCNGFSYRDPETNNHLGCDTKKVWLQGNKIAVGDIIYSWQQKGWLEQLANGAHLVVTGGEPTLQQPQLLNFFALLDKTLSKRIYIELETNATQPFLAEFIARIDQINTSPKLTNSGELAAKAYNVDVLKVLAQLDKAKFKFVISKQADIAEIFANYIEPFNIPAQRIWLMPEGGTRADIQNKAQWLVELCKQHLFHYSPRLQLDIWDQATGV